MEKVNVRGKARLFDNPVLESLTRTNPYITFFTYVPLMLIIFYLGMEYFGISFQQALLVSVAALFIWTLVEYLMHRYVYHFINENKWVQKFHYLSHGVHHHYPKDEGRLFLPPVPGLLMASLFFGVFYLIMGTWAFAFFPGFVTGYLGYVYMHWAIHKFRKPKNRFGYIWTHHNLHHFKYNDRAFGVSTPLWDHIFGTMPPKEEQKW